MSSSTARERFARAMRTLRQTKGLSQEDLAERAGLHRNYIGSVERGERNVGIDNLERIAQALETELIDLIGRSD
ncbi:helix-turn-helix domain-containing protein [Deinococcus aerophilus]|uniref:helix-turn-helix domain-containing protein n=1 Tax=Deinococcus aerophilus TaxID=522488 RepID=UPI001E4BE5AC|nr:helix-turn-helix transcriptional regulator [Deinococcus aerophilus]